MSSHVPYPYETQQALDYTKSGGAAKAELRTFRWELVL